jgi:hypothetical protein
VRVLLVHPSPPTQNWPKGVFIYPVVPTELAHAAALLRTHDHEVLVEQRGIRLVRENFNWTNADAMFGALLKSFAPEMVVFLPRPLWLMKPSVWPI